MQHWVSTTLGTHTNLATRYLVGNSTVTDGQWLDTHNNTLSLCSNQDNTDTEFWSLPIVPLVDERTVTTLSLPCHSTVTTWGHWQCNQVVPPDVYDGITWTYVVNCIFLHYNLTAWSTKLLSTCCLPMTKEYNWQIINVIYALLSLVGSMHLAPLFSKQRMYRSLSILCL